MFGLELLAVGMLYLSPEPVFAKVQCRAKTAPKINVLPTKSHVQYDFTKTKAELNEVDVNTVSPYGPQHKTYVSGLMSGAIKMKHQISFIHETYQQVDQGCLYLKSVDVKINIDPIIFIAKEYPQGSCMHTAVLAHERKHVIEDQLVVNRYANIIGRALAEAIDIKGSTYGPYKILELPQAQEQAQNSLHSIVQKLNLQMNEERQRRQQAIDNLEEYKSIGIRCKDYPG